MNAEDKLNTLLKNQELIIKNQDVWSSLVANGFTIVGLEDLLGNFKLFKGNNG